MRKQYEALKPNCQNLSYSYSPRSNPTAFPTTVEQTEEPATQSISKRGYRKSSAQRTESTNQGSTRGRKLGSRCDESSGDKKIPNEDERANESTAARKQGGKLEVRLRDEVR